MILSSIFALTWALTVDLITIGAVMKLFNRINQYLFKKFDLNYCWGYYPKLGFVKHYDLDYLLKKIDKQQKLARG